MIHCISKVKTKTTLKSIPQLQSPNKIVKISYPHHSIQLVSAYLTKAINTQELNLSYNLIAMIEPILKLKNLRILHLSNNLIECIPRNIVNLAKL
jgi:Leucine-rich repeat (LRR) protein